MTPSHLAERVDCSMCRHWTMMHCTVGDSHFPNNGHLCARFDEDPISREYFSSWTDAFEDGADGKAVD